MFSDQIELFWLNLLFVLHVWIMAKRREGKKHFKNGSFINVYMHTALKFQGEFIKIKCVSLEALLLSIYKYTQTYSYLNVNHVIHTFLPLGKPCSSPSFLFLREQTCLIFKEQTGGLKCSALQPLAGSMCVSECVHECTRVIAITDEVRGYALENWWVQIGALVCRRICVSVTNGC